MTELFFLRGMVDLHAEILSTGGSPPFDPDSNTPTNTNEPYLDWLNFVLAQDSIPQTFTTSYGDDEQTVSPHFSRLSHSF